MPVKRTIHKPYGTYFITFTCYKWMHLIEQANGYDAVYDWFTYLKEQGHYLNAYVIMPNHVHAVISFAGRGSTINNITCNGKRFMAYDIIKRLRELGKDDLLALLASGVEEERRKRNKLHEVWELSFDWKECLTKEFAMQKIKYIHLNPVSKKWNLSKGPCEYIHSSARYYADGITGLCDVTHIDKMEDISLV